MEPSEIRNKILDDHTRLRREAGQVERLARQAGEGERPPVRELRVSATHLLAELRQHMAWEERYLQPALLCADAWGEERAARLTAEHREQRAEMERLLEDLRDERLASPQIASRVLAWTQALYLDMEQEEAELVTPEVLRDDVVGIGVETG